MNKEMYDKYDIYELTPVQVIRGNTNVYLKRDDLYKPFKDIPINGGKVRQCLSLLIDNYYNIKDTGNSKVVCASNISSPQGIILSRCGREFGFKTEIFFGGSSFDSARKHTLVKNILEQGGCINTDCRMGYNQVVQSFISKKKQEGDKFFDTGFGFNLVGQKFSLIDTIAYQVQNLPKDLDILFVPCGSAITFSGILTGLSMYNIKPKRVIGIQIAGYDRTSTIDSIVGKRDINYEFIKAKDYPYNKYVRLSFAGVRLDRVYEAKAMDYIVRYMGDEIKDKKWCFWIVGDSSEVRDIVFYREF